MPHLKELVKLHKDQPFAVVGINCHDSEEVYRKGLEDHGLTWISAFHGEGENPISTLYQVQGFPTYYLIDADGRIVSSGHDGEAFDATIVELLAALAKKPGDDESEER
jgi:hypothetical protein